jgi:hypothetical protein
MHDLPPYVEASAHLPVHAVVRGACVEGVVLTAPEEGSRYLRSRRLEVGAFRPARADGRWRHPLVDPRPLRVAWTTQSRVPAAAAASSASARPF